MREGLYDTTTLLGLLADCQIADGERERIYARLVESPWDHRVRAILLSDNDRIIERDHGPRVLEAYRAYRARLDIPHVFGQASMQTFYLVNAYEAGLYCPGEPIQAGVRLVARKWFEHFDDNPAFALFGTVMGVSLGSQIEMMTEQCSALFTFGKIWTERLGRRRVRIIFGQCYAELLMAQAQGLLDAVLARQERAVERQDALDLDLDEGYIDLTWD